MKTNLQFPNAACTGYPCGCPANENAPSLAVRAPLAVAPLNDNVRAYCIRPSKGHPQGVPLRFAQWIFLQFCIFAFLPIFAQTVGTTKTFTDTRDGQEYKAVFMPDGRWWMAENLKYRKDLTNPVFSNMPVITNTQASLQAQYYCPGYGPLVAGVGATQADPVACEYWGVLYPWWAAMMIRNDGSAPYYSDLAGSQGICPQGWHLPSDKEWGYLLDSVERSFNPAYALLHTTTTTAYYGTTSTNKAGSYLKSSSVQAGNCEECNPKWISGTSTDNYGFNVIPTGYRTWNGASYVGRGSETYFWTSTKSTTANYAIYRGFTAAEVRAGRWDGYASYGLSVRCVEGGYAKIELTLCQSNDVYEIAVKNFVNYTKYVFSIDDVDQTESVESYRFFKSSDLGKRIKVRGYTTEGAWSAVSEELIIGEAMDTIPNAPRLAVNTGSATGYNVAITTTATAIPGCIVNFLTTASNGAISAANTLTYGGTQYTVYAASVNLSNGCVSSDRGMSTVILYSGNYVQRNLIPGTYQMECWGAKGGNNVGGYYGTGGNGGYTKGLLTLSNTDTVYVYVGALGVNGVTGNNTYTSAIYNGGGQGRSSCDYDDGGGAGGGASDIRLLPGAWNLSSGLKSRIMVAGGGGGGDIVQAYAVSGAHGGGLTGVGNVQYWPNVVVSGASVNGTQTSGASFGGGGIGWCGNGGGGGGYYGGKSNGGGGGGSGFISGHLGCDAITSETDGTHTGQPNHYSGLVFTNTTMSAGVRNSYGSVVIVRTGN